MEAEKTDKKRSGLGMRVLASLVPLLAVLLTMQRAYTRLVERQTLAILRAEHSLVVEARARVLEASAAARAHPGTRSGVVDAERARDEAVDRYERLLERKVARAVCGPVDAPCRP